MATMEDLRADAEAEMAGEALAEAHYDGHYGPETVYAAECWLCQENLDDEAAEAVWAPEDAEAADGLTV